MKGESHAIAGIATGVAVISAFQISPVIAIGTSLLGAMIVDIDAENSKINKWLFPVNIKYRLMLKLFIGASLLVLPMDFGKYIGAILILSIVSCKVSYKFSIWNGIQEFKYHRTIFHNPLIGGLILVAPLYILNLSEAWIVPYICGLASHYILDMFTAYGLPLYIFKGKKLRFPINYKSGNNFMEYGILGLYVLVVLGISIKPFGKVILEALR
jgi:membrane-bound metal-dependent hydrolase YbcI (DUF457 family)